MCGIIHVHVVTEIIYGEVLRNLKGNLGIIYYRIGGHAILVCMDVA